MARYSSTCLKKRGAYDRALGFYDLAHRTLPGNGMHRNQIAVVWASDECIVESIYWFSSALCSEDPPKSALLNLLKQLIAFYRRCFAVHFEFVSPMMILLFIISDCCIHSLKEIQPFKCPSIMVKDLENSLLQSNIRNVGYEKKNLYYISSAFSNLLHCRYFNCNDRLRSFYYRFSSWLFHQTLACAKEVESERAPTSYLTSCLPSIKVILARVLESSPAFGFIERNELEQLSYHFRICEKFFKESSENKMLNLFEDYNEFGLCKSFICLFKRLNEDIIGPKLNINPPDYTTHPFSESIKRFYQISKILNLLLS